jgi:hypothetical protein
MRDQQDATLPSPSIPGSVLQNEMAKKRIPFILKSKTLIFSFSIHINILLSIGYNHPAGRHEACILHLIEETRR